MCVIIYNLKVKKSIIRTVRNNRKKEAQHFTTKQQPLEWQSKRIQQKKIVGNKLTKMSKQPSAHINQNLETFKSGVRFSILLDLDKR